MKTKIKTSDKIQVFNIDKLEKLSQPLMFGLSCINCVNYDVCSKSKKERQQCSLNGKITNVLPKYNCIVKIETDSTKIFVDFSDNNDAEDTQDILKAISQNYTNNEVISFNIPRPRTSCINVPRLKIPYKGVKQNGRY